MAWTNFMCNTIFPQKLHSSDDTLTNHWQVVCLTSVLVLVGIPWSLDWAGTKSHNNVSAWLFWTALWSTRAAWLGSNVVAFHSPVTFQPQIFLRLKTQFPCYIICMIDTLKLSHPARLFVCLFEDMTPLSAYLEESEHISRDERFRKDGEHKWCDIFTL